MEGLDRGFGEALSNIDGLVHQVHVLVRGSGAMCGASVVLGGVKAEHQRCKLCRELKDQELARRGLL